MSGNLKELQQDDGQQVLVHKKQAEMSSDYETPQCAGEESPKFKESMHSLKLKVAAGDERPSQNLAASQLTDEKIIEAAIESNFDIIKAFGNEDKDRLESCEYKNDHGDRLLHLAAYHGCLNIVKHLVEVVKCNPESMNKYMNTPLHRASRQGKINVVKYLVDDQNCYPMCQCNWGRTPLHIACRHGQLDVVKYLMEDSRVDVKFRDKKHGSTPLDLAAEYASKDVVKYMIKDKKCYSSSDYTGLYTPLHFAAYRGNMGVVKYLVNGDHIKVDTKGTSNRTPLHSACKGGQLEIVEQLINISKADATLCDTENGFTPLDLAAEHGTLEVVKFLTDSNHCQITASGENRYTPLHYAAYGGKFKIVHYLIELKNLEPDCRGYKGRTPLHSACRNGKNDIVEYLIRDCGVDLSSCDDNGDTPLHAAVKCGSKSVVSLLIADLSCDPEIANENGKKPSDTAKEMGYDYIVILLQKAEQSQYHKLHKTMREQLKSVHEKAIQTEEELTEGTCSSVLKFKIISSGQMMTGEVFKLSSYPKEQKLNAKFDMIIDRIKNVTNISCNEVVVTKHIHFLPNRLTPVLLRESTTKSLHSYLLGKKSFTLKACISILHDIASGLDYLHRNNPTIVHGQLTAENILIDNDFKAKIAGLCNFQLDYDINPALLPGIKEYMPPEAQEDSVPDEPSIDVFSFGHLSLVTLLQREIKPLPPFQPSNSEFGFKLVSELGRRAHDMKEVERELSEKHHVLTVIEKCLQNNPKERPSAKKLLRTLEDKSPSCEETSSTDGKSACRERGEDNSEASSAADEACSTSQVNLSMKAEPNTENGQRIHIIQGVFNETIAGHDSSDHDSDIPENASNAESAKFEDGEDIKKQETISEDSLTHASRSVQMDLREENGHTEKENAASFSLDSGVDLSIPGKTRTLSPTQKIPVIEGAVTVDFKEVQIPPGEKFHFEWQGKGITIDIPAGAISTDSGPVTLSIQESYSGEYQFPDDSVLVSGVYWLALKPSMKFAEKATIRIQHCVDADSAPTFVTAKCTQKELPYKFKRLSGGEFTYPNCGSSTSYGYGCIQVEHFSAVAVAAREKFVYAFCTYYLPCSEPNEYNTHITVTPNLEPYVEDVKSNYKNKQGEVGPTIIAKIKEKTVSLQREGKSEIPTDNWVKNGWEIGPLTIPPTLLKELLDNYEPRSVIPCFSLQLRLIQLANAERLTETITFTGIEPETSIKIKRTPKRPSESGDGASGFSVDKETTYPALGLAQLTVLRIPGKSKVEIIKTVAPRWKNIGILMDFDATGKKLEQIETDKHDVEPCCQAMFQHWLEGNGVDPISWDTLMQILEDCNFNALAKQITDAIN